MRKTRRESDDYIYCRLYKLQRTSRGKKNLCVVNSCLWNAGVRDEPHSKPLQRNTNMENKHLK